jgi:hypothetical protein
MLSKRKAGRCVAQNIIQNISTTICLEEYPILYIRRPQPTSRVPSVTCGMIFNGTLSELKYSNCDLIKKTEFLIQYKLLTIL